MPRPFEAFCSIIRFVVMAERENSTGFATICDRNFQEAVEALGDRERDIENSFDYRF